MLEWTSGPSAEALSTDADISFNQIHQMTETIGNLNT